MPIKNYTTTVNATKTVAEIQTLLARHGARRVMLEYDGFGQPEAIAFDVEIDAGHIMPFLLRASVDGCLAALKKDKVPKRFQTSEQARRVAWRLTLNWIDVQLAFVEARQASMAKLLLGYAMTPDRRTVFDLLVEGEGRRLLAQHL